jgi:VanZ family protein
MTLSPKSRLFWLYWFPVIVYCTAIFVQSAYPSPDSLPVFPFSDKILHFLAYALMGGLFFRAFLRTGPRWGALRVIVFSVVATTLYGVGDEIHQAFVADRTAEGMDVAADFAGAVFGTLSLHASRLFHGSQ